MGLIVVAVAGMEPPAVHSKRLLELSKQLVLCYTLSLYIYLTFVCGITCIDLFIARVLHYL